MRVIVGEEQNKKGNKMTKYIHYKKRHSMGLLISNNVDETAQGYILGLEIDCECFDAALRHMVVTNGVPCHIQNNVVMNDNISGFKHAFTWCMDAIGEFAMEKYTIREHREDKMVAWYKKEVLPKI